MTGASKLEDYLIEQGFTPYYYTKTGWVKYEKSYISYSSMAISAIKYVKGNVLIYYGLSECNHPPCLLYPRNNIIEISSEHSYPTDSDIDNWFASNTVEDIYNILVKN